MKKNIKLLGKKIPITVVLIAFLLISTASAAVYTHYATMEGKVTIEAPITVSIDGTEVALGVPHEYDIENMISPCTIAKIITFNNSYSSDIDVELVWVLYEDNNNDQFNPSTSYWIWNEKTHTVPMGLSSHPVSLDVPIYMAGEYIFAIAVNPVIAE